MRQPLAPVLLLSLALVAMSCGDGSRGTSDEGLITETAGAFTTFLNSGEPGKANALLDKATQQSCDHGEFIDGWMSFWKATQFLKNDIKFDRVEDITVTASTATAKIFTATNGDKHYYEAHAVPFKKEKGEWEVAECYE